MSKLPRKPVLLDPALADPSRLERLLERHAPYWPVQRYFANSAEYAALSGKEAAPAMPVAPVFRGDWAVRGEVREGVDELLHDPHLVGAARELFGAELVRPDTVYVNLTWQLPFPQGRGHTDVPAFRGFDRSRYPITFLTIMGVSGLFEDVRVKIATAVAWFYAGADGGFEYWPQGPDGPPAVHEGRIWNTAIVGDNDFMWHRVRPVGTASDGMASLSLESELVCVADRTWTVVDGGRELARFPREKLRVSLSWKAVVFDDEEDRRRHDEHDDEIGLDEVLERFRRDLAARGIALRLPEDPLRDPELIATLQGAYVRYPARFAA